MNLSHCPHCQQDLSRTTKFYQRWLQFCPVCHQTLSPNHNNALFLKTTPPHLSLRLLARLIDVLFLCIISCLLYQGFYGDLETLIQWRIDFREVDSIALSSINMLMGLIWFAYFVIMHHHTGQTLGKWFCHLTVYNMEEQPISLLQSVIREIAILITLALGAGLFVVAAFTQRKQGLHDLLSKTQVYQLISSTLSLKQHV